MMEPTSKDDDDSQNGDNPQVTPEEAEHNARPDDAIELEEEELIMNQGTILEAAFVDPAYQWPPPDGQGKNAIELKASQSLMEDLEHGDTEFNPTSQTLEKKKNTQMVGKKGVRTTKTVVEESSYRGFWCCKWDVKNHVVENERQDPFTVDEHGNVVPIKSAATGSVAPEQAAATANTAEDDRNLRYGKVPEGVLIYRLNTTTRKLQLLSEPHSNTNLDELVRELTIKKASPAKKDKSRRGIDLVGEDGTKCTLVACEQRTATAWLEVLEMMLGGSGNKLVRSRICFDNTLDASS